MAIGIDVSTQLNNPPLEGNAIDWNIFVATNWGHRDLFVGRYFVGRKRAALDPCRLPQQPKAHHFWVPGELAGTPKEVKYILPIGGTEHYTSTWNGVAQPNKFFFRQSGFCSDTDTKRASDKRIFDMGLYWGFRTCDGIAEALNFKDSAGNPELMLPASGSVYVYLDVEPWTLVHPQYWAGWSSAVRNYMYSDRVNGRLQTPFFPCLYCFYFDGKDRNGGDIRDKAPLGVGQWPFPTIPGPDNALPANGLTGATLASPYGQSCVGLFATQALYWDWEATHIHLDDNLLVPDKIDQFATSLQDQWGVVFKKNFSINVNGEPMEIPIFFWQFAIEVAGARGGAIGSTLLPSFANLRDNLGVDLVATNPNVPAAEDLDQTTVTDHMLVRYS